MMKVQPYLFFDGRCDEAIEFYREVLGAEILMLMRFKDSPEGDQNCGGGPLPAGDKVMHCEIQIGETTLMASDGDCKNTVKFEGFSLTLECEDEAEAEKKFGALSDGGQVQMPLQQTFFSPKFGMTADRFGMSWMVMVTAPVA